MFCCKKPGKADMVYGLVGKRNLSTTALRFLLTSQCSPDHGIGAADVAFHFDRIRNAVLLAGTAFHAGGWTHQRRLALVNLEHRVRTDIHAHATAIAQGGIVEECILKISVEPGLYPIRARK